MRSNSLSAEQMLILNEQLCILYCQEYEIQYTLNLQSNFQDNKYQETVAMWITKQGFCIPRYWMHNYNIENIEQRTIKSINQDNNLPFPQNWQNEDEMTIFDKAYFGIIPDIQDHKLDEQNEDGFTVAMILALNNIEIPNKWKHSSSIRNKYGYSVAMYLADKGFIPDNQWNHDKYLRCKYKGPFYTVQNILQIKNIYINSYWSYDPLNNEEETQQMLQAKKGIIPKADNIDTSYQDKSGYTVAMLIARYCKKLPPKEWYHNPEIVNKYGVSVAMFIARECLQIPPKEWEHKNYLQNKSGWTVATYIAWYCKQIPRQPWIHNSSLQDNYGTTIAMFIALYCKQLPPKEWEHRSDIQNSQGYTVAMYITISCKQIPQHQWDHDPSLQNKEGKTVAMYIVEKLGQIPPKQWQHDPQLRNKNGFTVKDLLKINQLEVPEQWEETYNYQNTDQQIQNNDNIQYIQQYCKYYNLKQQNITPQFNQNKDKRTVAMFLANNGIIPPEEFNHLSTLKDNKGYTVAMLLAKKEIIPPTQWQHDKFLRVRYNNNEYYTVYSFLLQSKKTNYSNYEGYWYYKFISQHEDTPAMNYVIVEKKIPEDNGYYPISYQNQQGETLAILLAKNGIIPPEKFYYKNLLWDHNGFTVAMYLAKNNIIPPQIWMHDINQINIFGCSIKRYLENGSYLWIKDQIFVLNVIYFELNRQCMRCKQCGVKQFIYTYCNHDICLQCFKELVQQKQYQQCPICNKYNWYHEIKQIQHQDLSFNSYQSSLYSARSSIVSQTFQEPSSINNESSLLYDQ